MGLFSFNKRYTLLEAKQLLQTKKYENYTAILVDEAKQLFKLEHEEKAMLEARAERLRQKSNEQVRTQFLNRINGEGAYKNNIVGMDTEKQTKNEKIIDISTNKRYNNYQNARKYQDYLEGLEEAR